MDVQSFADFLKAELQKNIDVFTNNIINVAYDKIENMHRAAGACDILKQLSDGMGNIVESFINKQNAPYNSQDNNSSSN